MMYVANAGLTDYHKLLLLINNTTTAVANAASTATAVNAQVKTRW